MKTIKQKLKASIHALSVAGIDSPGLDAELLIAFALGKPREFLYAHSEESVSRAEQARIDRILKRRIKREPVAYILGTKKFYGMELAVSPAVLIPRPETEMLVDEAIGVAPKRGTFAIADIGTGSGAVAIALAKNLPRARVLATDVAEKGIEIAKKNAKRHGAKITFLKGDLVEPIKRRTIYILVANLPYLSKKVYEEALRLYPEIAYEPKGALLADKDGLELIERLLEQVASAPTLKRALRHIILEIGHDQGVAIKRLAREHLKGNRVTVKRDLCRNDRIAVIRL